MPQVRLTERIVQEARLDAGKAVDFLWDIQCPGFALRLTKTTKVFVAQFRLSTGKTVRREVAACSEMGVVEARTLAHQLISNRDEISDQEARTQDTKPLLVDELLTQFISDYIMKRHKPSSIKEEIRVINKILRPQFGYMPLTKLTRAMIADWHGKYKHPTTANRALAFLSSACNFAVMRDLIAVNPCEKIKRNKENIRDRYFSDAELQLIGKELNGLDNTFRSVIITLAITGLRLGSVLNLRPEDINFERRVILLPDSKTGRIAIPLTAFTANILQHETLLRETVDMGKHRTTIQHRIAILLRKCGIVEGSAHTFRHTLATFMAEHGNSVFEIAAMGGWKHLAMVQRYVSMNGIGERHPLPADERIAKALGIAP